LFSLRREGGSLKTGKPVPAATHTLCAILYRSAIANPEVGRDLGDRLPARGATGSQRAE